MNIELSAFVGIHRLGESATRPLKRLNVRLSLSLLVAGPGLPPRSFAASTRSDASSDASICGF